MIAIKNILLIDCGHIVFYTFFKSYNIYIFNRDKNYSKMTEEELFLRINLEEETEDELLKNQTFLKIVNNIFMSTTKYLRYKYKTSFQNMIFIRDSPYEKCWRRNYFESYKNNRHVIKYNNKSFSMRNLFVYAYEKVFPYLIENFKIKYIQVLKAEADDIISIICRYLPPYINLFIISSDKDFLQLLTRKNIFIYSIDGNFINNKLFGKTAIEHLLYKIILGDKSDNISSCFSNDQHNLYYFHHPKEFYELLNNNEQILQKFNLNRILIDFSFIPNDIICTAIEILHNYYPEFRLLPPLIICNNVMHKHAPYHTQKHSNEYNDTPDERSYKKICIA